MQFCTTTSIKSRFLIQSIILACLFLTSRAIASQYCPNNNLAINGDTSGVNCSGYLTINGVVNPGNIVSVTLNGKTYQATADAQGNFSIGFSALPYPSVPYYNPTVTTWASNNPSCITTAQPFYPVLVLSTVPVLPRGSISLTAAGGNPPYTVYVDGSSQGLPFNTVYNTTLWNLSSGMHTLKVTDSTYAPFTVCATIQVTVS